MDFINDTYEEDTFAREYSRLVSRCVRPLFLQGADYDDLYQEGMIGLLIAIRNYDKCKSDNFEAFATLCIKRRLYDAVRRCANASEKQQLALNKLQWSDSASGNPESEVLANESAKEIQMALSGLLSAFESSVLGPYLEGFTASEIAAQLEKPVKSVENAVARIRRKLWQYLSKGRQQE